ncbi:MAG: hypothetical protein IAF02_03105 [Anaerolineae bacterium]|nr:hypothetical protein [Anaerolineae bacterium]
MKKLIRFGLYGAVIGGFSACILLIGGSTIGETVHSWGKLVSMDSLVMVFFLKIKSMTLAEVKLAIVGFFTISGFVFGMFVASFYIVGDVFSAMIKGAFWFSLFSILLVATTDTPAGYYLPIGAALGAVVGAIVAALGEL